VVADEVERRNKRRVAVNIDRVVLPAITDPLSRKVTVPPPNGVRNPEESLALVTAAVRVTDWLTLTAAAELAGSTNTL